MRKPRPQGTTMLALHYQQYPNEDTLNKLINHILYIWVTNGFNWDNNSFTIPEMAQFLKIPESEITDKISKTATNMGSLVSPETIEETAKTLITLSTSFSLQDRGTIQNQLHKLLKSQGDTYKPFISSEVNRTLKLMLESNRNLMEVYKSFFTSSNNVTQILNLLPSPTEKNQEDLLTPEKALDLLDKQNTTSKALNPSKNLSLPSSKNSNNKAADNDPIEVSQELEDRYQLGDVERQVFGISGPSAHSKADDAVLKSRKAEKLANTTNQHADFEGRRGHEVIDLDELPD